MSYDITQKVKVTNPASSVDWYYGGENGYWESLEQACTNVPKELRQIGKTIAILENGSVVEYWWKSGIEDSDLVLKFGLNTKITNEYVDEFSSLGGVSSITIPQVSHRMGLNPFVQCYLNGRLALFDVNNNDGDIVVSWGNTIRNSDVVGIRIVSTEKKIVYDGDNNTFTISADTHDCGEYPFVQCWLDGKLTICDIENNNGDITATWNENIVIENELYFVFNSDVYTDVFTNENDDNSLLISKATHGKGDTPVVQCYIGSEMAVLDAEISDGDITISWENSADINALNPLRIVIVEQKASEESVTYDINDLVVIGERVAGDGGITTTKNVGGIEKDKFIEKNTLLNKLLRDMLAPSIAPVVTQPTATIKTSATDAERLLEVGGFVQPTIYIDYNQGEIKVNGVKTGNTAGEATKYTFTNGANETDNGTNNTISPVIQMYEECVVSYSGSVAYAEGEQPQDNYGNNTGNKLDAGTINTSNSVSFEFVYPVYANTNVNNLTTTYKQPLVSKSKGFIEITFPKQNGGNIDRYTFEMPVSFNVRNIIYYNTFAMKYDDDSKLNDFRVTDIMKDGIAYKRYTYKNSVYIESNTFKIIW